MSGIDPQNPPAWVKRLIERVATAEGEHFHVEAQKAGGEGSANIVSLGAGTFVAPLPFGWSLHPARPFEGRIRVKEGYDIHYRIDSHEDVEAAASGPRLLRYVNEPEFKDTVKSPADVRNDFLISIPGPEPEGKDIIWKCVEPFAGTHVRELVLRCPLVNDELVEHRASIARAIAEWMGMGGFSPELTALDRVAHTEALRRTDFQNLTLMRVPRDWAVSVEREDEGVKLFAIHDPADRHTLWMTTAAREMPNEKIARSFIKATAALALTRAEEEAENPWAEIGNETLSDDDLLLRMSGNDASGFHGIRWRRYALRDETFVWADIDLVTPVKHLGHPDTPGIFALFEREVRNAMLSRPARERE